MHQDLDLQQLSSSVRQFVKHNKATRSAGWAWLQAFSSQVKKGTCRGLEEFCLPADCKAEPLKEGCVRMVNPETGCFGIWDTLHNKWACPAELPPTSDLGSIPLLVCAMDRCKISYSVLHYLMDREGLLVMTFFDEAHDEWNQVQQACKSCDWYGWGTVCAMSLVFNAWPMPFGSRAFAKVRQECLSRLLKEGPNGPTLQKFLPEITSDQGWELETGFDTCSYG